MCSIQVALSNDAMRQGCTMTDDPFHRTNDSMLLDMQYLIHKKCGDLADFLCEKNKAYGNSAADPIGIFSKGLSPAEQIGVRIDDKLNRLKKGKEFVGDDTILDLTGYLILLMIVRENDKKEGVE